MSSNPDSSAQTHLQKKSLIVTLAAVRDVPGLLRLLQYESQEQLVIQIIEALGALGQPRAIPALEHLVASTDNKKIKITAQESIDVILNMFNY